MDIRSASGALVARVDTDGAIRSMHGALLARFTDDGTLRSAAGASLGSVRGGDVREPGGALAGEGGGYGGRS
ncbi:MAG: hypothetical protein AAF938_04130 [Myxococcota bacterium]